MKAAICYEFGQPLVVEDIQLAPPKAGEIEVKLAACAICHSDIHYIDGAWGGVLPAVYGHEAAGVVTKVGSGVSRVKAGDHVAAGDLLARIESRDLEAVIRAAKEQLEAAETAYDKAVRDVGPARKTRGVHRRDRRGRGEESERRSRSSHHKAISPLPKLDMPSRSEYNRGAKRQARRPPGTRSSMDRVEAFEA